MRARPAWILVLLALAPLAVAQIPGLGGSSTPATPAAPADALGRTTPRDTLIGFSRAVDRQDFVTAARYLQLQGPQKRNAASLAIDLKNLIDHEMHESIGKISDQPAGALDDGLPEDQEQIGPLLLEGQETFI